MNGINAIPRTHNGEGLAYISPEEAIWLRQMGGGVPANPQTGQLDPRGQLRGPGGIPSFQQGGEGGSGGGAPGWVTSGAYRNPRSPYYQPPVGRAAPAVVVEEEPYSNEPTEEEIAERQAKLDQRILAGRDRYLAALQSLGYGPPQALYGETSTGEQLFPEGRTGEQIPAWSGLFGSPAGESIRVALGSDQPAQPAQPGQPSAGLLERVAAIAEGLRPQEPTEPPAQTAAHGGLIGRYDLGGLVNAMMLQASRSRDNIPSNMVL